MLLGSTKVSSYQELPKNIKLFVFDLCGVVHNGIELIRPTIQFINYLRNQSKSLIFLSNNPRPSNSSREQLFSKNFKLLEGEDIITSGDFFIHQRETNPAYKNSIFYFFGNKNTFHKLADAGMSLTDDLEKADYLISSPFSSDKKEIEDLKAEIAHLVKYKKPLICINPDIYAPHGNEIRCTPGYFAKYYQELGGEVKYFGKPNAEIYEFALSKIISSNQIKKDEILMVGDSMNTDVRGAKNFGIKSLLIGGYYHRDKNLGDDQIACQLFDEFGFTPDFYMPEVNF